MNRLCFLVALTACGSSPPASPTMVNSVAPTPTEPDPTRELVARSFTETDTGVALRVWLGPDRDRNIDTSDPCCGLAYDGNRYDDALASCALADDECGPGKDGVYPGLADDPVCGERRRCVPLPLARLIVRDGTSATAVDGDDQPLAAGSDPSAVPHAMVTLGREGFVYVTIADRTERIALDYGSRYTITVAGGRIERVSVDI